MRIFVERKTYQHPHRSQWTISKNMFADTKADGTADRRKSPREGRRQIHTHVKGYKRFYRDGCLAAERY
jgi:hypothetical protein